MLDEFGKNGKLDVAKLADMIADEELRSEVLALAMAENKYDDPASAVKECMTLIKRASARKRAQELMDEVSRTKDDEKISGYMLEIQKINKELHNLNDKESHERTGT